MCGLFHEVGKLYILTKAKQYRSFMGDTASLDQVLDEWYPQVGSCIVEAWEFPRYVIESMDPDEFMDNYSHLPPSLVKVVYAAELLLANRRSEQSDYLSMPACQKLGLDDTSVAMANEKYKLKLASFQHSLA